MFLYHVRIWSGRSCHKLLIIVFNGGIIDWGVNIGINWIKARHTIEVVVKVITIAETQKTLEFGFRFNLFYLKINQRTKVIDLVIYRLSTRSWYIQFLHRRYWWLISFYINVWKNRLNVTYRWSHLQDWNFILTFINKIWLMQQ